MSSKARFGVKKAMTALALAGLGVALTAAQSMPDGRPTPTGQPVPRWLTLKSSQVRARYGPGLDYRIMWEYRAAGLPVQVIAETREWRKICDPEGSVAWVHRTVVSSRRSVFNPSDHEVAIRTGRSETASLRARLSPHALISVEECKDGWCRVRSHKMRGWVAQQGLFGVQDRALCNAGRPAGPGRR